MIRQALFLVTTLGVLTASSLWAENILFVGGDAVDPIAGDDGFVFDHLDGLGHDVTYMEGNQVFTGDEEDFDLLIISSTLGSGSVRGKFQDSPIPILNWEEALMRGTTEAGNFSMGGHSNNGGRFPGTQLEIIELGHPLAAGLSGVVEYAADPIAPANLVRPAPGVISIASLPAPSYVEGNAPPVGNNRSIRMHGSGTIEVPTIERPGGEFAYSFWFNADSDVYGDTFDTGDPRVDLFYGDGEGGTVRPHVTAHRDDRPIGIYVHDGAADVGEPIEALSDSFDTDTWHHILISYDGDLGRVFVNGELDNEVDLGGIELGASGTGMHIGTTQNSTNPFIGYLDEVAVWGRSLSAAEVATIFQQGVHALGNAQPGPLGYWPMDDQSNPNTVVDASGSELTGTSVGNIAISGVEEGGELDDGTLAAGKRVNFPMVDQGFASLTDDGLSLFNAAIDWLLGNTVSVPGDFNNDGLLTVIDVDLLSENVQAGTHDAQFDLTADNLVNFDDMEAWVQDLKNTWFGDADLNGEFNTTDLVNVFQAGKFETGQPATWATGDWDADGLFSTADFVEAFQDGGFEKGPRDQVQAVPEPSAFVLLGFAVLAILRRRRRC